LKSYFGEVEVAGRKSVFCKPYVFAGPDMVVLICSGSYMMFSIQMEDWSWTGVGNALNKGKWWSDVNINTALVCICEEE